MSQTLLNIYLFILLLLGPQSSLHKYYPTVLSFFFFHCMLNPGAYLPWAVFTGSPLKLFRNVNNAAGPNAVQFSRWSCVGSVPKHNERKLETQPGVACRHHRSSCVITTRSSVCLGDLFLGRPCLLMDRPFTLRCSA